MTQEHKPATREQTYRVFANANRAWSRCIRATSAKEAIEICAAAFQRPASDFFCSAGD